MAKSDGSMVAGKCQGVCSFWVDGGFVEGYETIPDKESTVHTLLLGTHTSDKMPNSLILAHVLMPSSTSSECTLESLSDDLVSFGALARASQRIKVLNF